MYIITIYGHLYTYRRSMLGHVGARLGTALCLEHHYKPRSQGHGLRGFKKTYTQFSRARALACAVTDI